MSGAVAGGTHPRSSHPAGPVRLFCADLDGTLVGNIEATRRFARLWESLPAHRRPLLCYSSGRLLADVLELIGEMPLPSCDYIIGGVGTQIYRARGGVLLDEYARLLDDGWSIEIVDRVLSSVPGIERQPARYLHRHKSSWYLHDTPAAAIEEIRRRLDRAGVRAAVVYSSSRDLDIVPGIATKGRSLAWLCERLRIPLGQVLVAGDSGNDAAMFQLPGVRGIVVANALPELYEAVAGLPTYAAGRPMGDGVLEGLVHFRVLPDRSGPDTRTGSAQGGVPSPRELPPQRDGGVRGSEAG